jgi:hypothetical protein
MPATSPDERSDGGTRLVKLARWVLIAIGSLAVVGMTGWSALFLWLSPLPNEWLRVALAVAFVIATAAAFMFVRHRWRTLVVFLLIFALLVGWYFSIPPSNDRDWERNVAILPTAAINGNLVEIRNIRNFQYRTKHDYTPGYYDRTFDLDKLESVDLITVYWGSPAIAHIITSFGFSGGEYVAFSIEMRHENGEPGSMVKSFFRKYELVYVVADERDVLGLRAKFRQPIERVHIYRTRLPLEHQRTLFLSYVEKVNALAQQPEWYNTLQDNCTTGVLERTRSYSGRGRYNWKILLSGYAAEYAYDVGMVDTSVPFDELERLCLVNERIEQAGDADDFSKRIREGLPKPEPYTLREFEAPG